jgi:isocitrate/isopropylmalate dehydrogenase
MTQNAKKYTIAVIPGDGIGKEVTPWAQKALEKAAEGVATFEYENFDLGAERYLRDGAILPDEDLERIKKTDAILLGAVGDPRIKAGILERGLLLKLRFDARPVREPAPVQAVQGRRPRRSRTRATSISWWCVRAPKACTAVPAARSAAAPRTRWPPRSPSTPRTAWSAWCVTPSSWR